MDMQNHIKKSIDGGSFWHLSNLKWKAVSSRILSHLYSYIFFPMGLRILCRNFLRWFLLMELFHSNLVLQNFVKQICSCKSVIGFLFIQILFREFVLKSNSQIFFKNCFTDFFSKEFQRIFAQRIFRGFSFKYSCADFLSKLLSNIFSRNFFQIWLCGTI